MIFDRAAKSSRRHFLRSMGGVSVAGLLPARLVAAPTPTPRRVIIVGAGIAGLVAAREIERQGSEAIVVEARGRVGGRVWTHRSGDRVEQTGQADQRVAFSPGLHFDAGAARIPSHHDQYLALAREYGVSLDILVNTSRGTWLGTGADRIRLRTAANDLRGHLSELLEKALRSGALDQELDAGVRGRLAAFLKIYGDLDGDDGYHGSTRAGFARIPGSTNADQPLPNPPLTLDALLANDQLANLLYEEDISLQPTMLHAVEGMDSLPRAIAASLRNAPRLNSEVREIRRHGTGVRIAIRDRSTGRDEWLTGDRAIITTPLPILARIPADFSSATAAAIAATRYADAIKIAFESPPFWEAEQIYGGISFVGGETVLVWYPSGNYQAKRQILLGAYAQNAVAARFAAHAPAERIALARRAVERLHPGHGRDLSAPVAVDWRNTPFSEGAWVDWTEPGNDAKAATRLNDGDGPFHFAGSHLSAYSGHWQEGAILSARHAVAQALAPERTNA